MSERQTRPSLMRRLTDANDVEAWNEFLRTYGPLVRYGALRAGIRDPDVDDVVQEVLLAVRRKLVDEGYDPKRWKVTAWLRTVSRNQAVTWVRKNRRYRRGAEGLPDDLAGRVAEGRVIDDSGWISEEEWERLVRSCVLERALELARAEFREQTFRAFEITSVRREIGPGGETLLLVTTDDTPEGSVAQAVAETGLEQAQVYRATHKVRQRLMKIVLELVDEEDQGTSHDG